MLLQTTRQVNLIILTIILFGITFQNTVAQSQVEPPTFSYRFAQFLTFSGKAGIPVAGKQALIYVQMTGETDIFRDNLIISPTGNYNYHFPLQSHSPRAFSQITAWIEIENPGAEKITSQSVHFIYEDNRYEWQQRYSEPFNVHWYQGDQAFGQKLLDISSIGLEKIRAILPYPAPPNIHIYTYGSAKELRSTMQISGHNWIGAHADPDLNVIMISLPQGPEQQLEMERQIPHELMHIILYHEMGAAYPNLPVWLNEGLASIAELYPNPDYILLIENAYKENALIPMANLCQAFPPQASSTFLAYAQSSSFIRYLQKTYGSSSLVTLIEAYQNSMDCERGVEYALGKGLAALELEWRKETFGEILFSTVMKNFLPWILILVISLIFPIAISVTSFLRKKDH